MPFAGASIAAAYLYVGKPRSTSLALFVLAAIIAKSIYNIVSANIMSRPPIVIEPVFILSVATLALLLVGIVIQRNNNA
jgi:hypothetical protein